MTPESERAQVASEKAPEAPVLEIRVPGDDTRSISLGASPLCSIWEAAKAGSIEPRELAPPLFVSYATVDRVRFVEPLVEHLRQEGFSVWADWRDIRAGDALEREINRGLKTCSALIAVLTPRSVDPRRKWIRYEHIQALETFFVPVIPVVVEHCQCPPYFEQLHRKLLLPQGVRNGRAVYAREDLGALREAVERVLLRRGTWIVNQTPPVDSHFVGRNSELRRLVSSLKYGALVDPKWRPTESTVVVHGAAGIGKTTLVKELARRIGPRFPGGVIFEKRGSDAPDDLQATLQRWTRNLAGKTPSDIDPVGLRNRLADAGELLVIIDDVWPADFETVNTLCNEALPTHTERIVTTRFKDLATDVGGREFPLEPLGQADGVDLLRDRLRDLGPPPAPEILNQLCTLLGGHALALALAAGRCNDTARLQEQVGRLEREIRQGNLSDVAMRVFKNDGDKSLAASFDASFRELESRSGTRLATRFTELGVLAEEAAFDRVAAAAVWDTDPDEAEEALDELVNYALLTCVVGTGTFTQHPLLRAYAFHLLQQDPRRAEVAADRHLRHYRMVAKEFKASEWREFEHHEPNIAIAGKRASSGLPESLVESLSDPRPATITHDFAEEAAREAMDFALASARYVWLRRVHAGQRWLRAGLAGARLLGERRSEATLLTWLGVWRNERGERKEALAYFEQALPIWEQLWKSSGKKEDGSGLTWALGNLGVVHRAIDEPDRALELYHRSLEIQEQLDDRPGQAITLGCIGVIFRDLGRHKKALEYYEASLEIEKRLGNLLGQSIVLNNIGRAYRDLKQPDQALEHLDQALPLAKRVGNDAGQAIIFNNYGNVFYDQGQAAGATARPGPGKAQLRLLLRRIAGLGRALAGLAIARRAAGASPEQAGGRRGVPAALSKGADDPLRLTAKALKYFEKAVPIRERIWDWARLAVSFHNIGEALYAMRRSEEALDYFDRALKLEDQVDDYAGKAATLYAKARLLHGTEEPASETLAQTVLAEAIETLQSKSLKITSAGTSLEYMLELLEDWRAARPTVPAPGPTI